MIITILDTMTIPGDDDRPATRVALIDIARDGPSYRLRVGGIPAGADVQQHCDARAAELWQVARERGELSDGRKPRGQQLARVDRIIADAKGMTPAEQRAALVDLATIVRGLLEAS